MSRMPSGALISFSALINPFKPKRAPVLILGYWAT